MSGIRITNMPQFTATLQEYRRLNKRDDATIVATKMFYIARGAVRNTYRTPKSKIAQEMRELFKGQHVQHATVKRFTSTGRTYLVPLVALLVQAQRSKRGQKGLYGAELAKESASFIGKRLRSIAFIAAGFIPAIKRFEPLAEKRGAAPPRDGEVKQIGQPKGSGTMQFGFTPKAIIENFAQAQGKTGADALTKYAGEGLQQAFDHEMSSMQEYIRRKKQETADKFNAR